MSQRKGAAKYRRMFEQLQQDLRDGRYPQGVPRPGP